MKEEDKLYKAYGRDTGFRVPEGFFDEFEQRVTSALPEYPEAPAPVRLSRWQRVKPYVYLAAMFLGIWCMMKVFHDISERAAAQQDAVPENVVLAMADQGTADYVISVEEADMSDVELEQYVGEQYDDIKDFEADFDYDMKPEYASIEIN